MSAAKKGVARREISWIRCCSRVSAWWESFSRRGREWERLEGSVGGGGVGVVGEIELREERGREECVSVTRLKVLESPRLKFGSKKTWGMDDRGGNDLAAGRGVLGDPDWNRSWDWDWEMEDGGSSSGETSSSKSSVVAEEDAWNCACVCCEEEADAAFFWKRSHSGATARR